jgi:hypothetical protein
MTLVMRPYKKADCARVLDICVAAFEPIHSGFEEALGSRIFKLQYQDWKEQYAATLRTISTRDPNRKVLVAELDGAVAGFVFTILDAKRKTGEIGLNAVDPKLHSRGIGTGGDAAHAPARRAYEAIGFDKALPGLHLFKVL